MTGLIQILDNFLLLGGDEKGGSLKNYLMRHLVQKGIESGELKKDRLVVEICAGKSALALAMVGQEYGLRIKVHVPEHFPCDVIPQIQDLGAEVVVREKSKFMETLFEMEKTHTSGEGYWLRQNFNPQGKDAYSGLAGKAVAETGSLDSFVCGIGSGTALQSFGLALLGKNPQLKLLGIFSEDIAGLRPEKMRIKFPPYDDMGSRAYLEKLFPCSLQFFSLSRDEVEDAKRQLYDLGVQAGDSTAAVYTLMMRNSLKNSLGLAMDGKLIS